MKKLFLLMLLPLFSMVAVADEAINSLVVWAKDGTKVAYALAEKPKLTFTESELVVKTDSIEVTYALEQMSRFTYESGSVTGITDLRTDTPFSLINEALVFPALPANSMVSVYSLNGSLVFKKTIRTAGEYAFPLSGLNTGVYLVNVNAVTYKIIKK